MAKSKKNDQLTSVKVHQRLFEDFKVMSIRTKVDFTKLVNRSLYLYITDDEYAKRLNNQINTLYSGSI